MSDNNASTRIKKLSPLLINQLAAGEVVTRPAAVVKELLENAIDAGSTNIEVHITQGGMGMIEVIDNGIGIHPDDMAMAITRHATSKVADVANLHGITTLGFRGEALAATAAVSRLTLTSSHDDSGVGRQLQVAGVLADTPKLVPVVHNRGTTVTVKDLYFNVPARRGNLKSIATEFGHIETIVREVALARADVALTLFHDHKKRLSLSASTTGMNNHDDSRLPLPRLEQATGMALTDNALAISIDLTNLIQLSVEYGNSNISQAAISGWLWPLHHEKSDLPKLIYVNGRLVREALISNQMRQLAQRSQLIGMGYALYFDLPTQWLNINVHPSKQRIKISPLNNIMAHLNHAVQSQLKTISAPTSVPTSKVTSSKISDSSDSDISNSDMSKGNLSELSVSNALSTNGSSHNGQVQAPRQPYQPDSSQSFSAKPSSSSNASLSNIFPSKPLSQESTHAYIDERSGQASSSSSLCSAGMLASVSLPVCLDIIDDVEAIGIDSNAEDKQLPWLLFYHQGQCFMIAETDWQSKLNQLFESQILSNKVLHKDKLPNSAREVNHQLITMSQQMSTQDLMLFITDIEALLIKNSIKAISSSHLVTLMLLSTPEEIPS